MDKQLSEEQVLEELGINNFSQLTKDNVNMLGALQDKMSPEVAKKAILQFPEFSKTMKEILADYKISLDKGLAANDKSIMRYYDSCDAVITSLQKQLDRRFLTFKKRKYIIDQMMELENLIGEKDTENKKFILNIFKLGLAAVAIVAFAIVGENSNINIGKIGKK